MPGTRGLIVAGAGCGDPDAVLALAEALWWPVLADPRSGLRSRTAGAVAAADGILRSTGFAATHRPDVVLRLGGRWASKVVTTFLADLPFGGGRAVRLDRSRTWRLTASCAATRRRSVGPSPMRWRHPAVVGRTGTHRGRASGEARQGRADQVLWTELHRSSHQGRATREPRPSRPSPIACSRACRPAAPSSSPPRCRSATSSRSARRAPDPPRVLANRGANGIDGVVSTALGVAVATGPTVAFVGDLAFLHDVSALVGPAGDRPAVDRGRGGQRRRGDLLLPAPGGPTCRPTASSACSAPRSRPIRRRWPGGSDGTSSRSTAPAGRPPSTPPSHPSRAGGWSWCACPTGRPMSPPTTGSMRPSWRRSTRRGGPAPSRPAELLRLALLRKT